jgi:hypothetical protein
MKRRSLIKSILTLAAAPKILSKIDFKPTLVAKMGATTTLFNDLNFVIPDYLPKLLKKYGNDEFDFAKQLDLIAEDAKQNPRLYEFKNVIK